MKGYHKNQYNNPRLNSGAVLNEKLKDVEEVVNILESALNYAKLKMKHIKNERNV